MTNHNMEAKWTAGVAREGNDSLEQASIASLATLQFISGKLSAKKSISEEYLFSF